MLNNMCYNADCDHRLEMFSLDIICQWLTEHSVFDAIYNINNSIDILKCTEDIFKTYMRNKLLTKAMQQKFMDFIDNSDADVRSLMYKFLKGMPYYNCFDLSLFIRRYKELKKIEFYTEDFFSYLESLCSYYSGIDNISDLADLTENVIETYYE